MVEDVVRLIRRLHELSGGPDDPILESYGYDDLSDQLDLLAVQYHDAGDVGSAIRTLRESRELCEEHGLGFDASDLLEEYLNEKRAATIHSGQNGSRTASRKNRRPAAVTQTAR